MRNAQAVMNRYLPARFGEEVWQNRKAMAKKPHTTK
jgi:hypothetical protein